MLFLDGGLRLSEPAGLQVPDVDLRDRIVYVGGKASRGSGPRPRAVPLGSRRPGRWIAICGSGGARVRPLLGETGGMPLIDVTYDGKVGGGSASPGELLPDVVGEAVEC